MPSEADEELTVAAAGEELNSATVLSVQRIVDRLDTDAGTVVMVQSGTSHRIVRLSLLGEAILDAVGDGTTLSQLEVAMMERLGAPPEGDVSVVLAAAARGLVEAGLLRTDNTTPDVT